MARVTKLPIDVLKAKAEATPVFAPGLDNMVQTGGIHAVWDEIHLWRRSLRPCCNGRRDRTIAPGPAPSVAAGLEGGRDRRSSCRARGGPRIRGRHMAEALQRHTIVTASATGWAAAMSRNPALASEPIIEGWGRAGRLLVDSQAGLPPIPQA